VTTACSIDVRERTRWRPLYETAARADEVLRPDSALSTHAT
jgi:hypothetical protein